MIISGEPARQPTVYVGFQAAYPLAHYLRGFPGSLPASPVFTRAPDLPARKRPMDAGLRAANSADRMPQIKPCSNLRNTASATSFCTEPRPKNLRALHLLHLSAIPIPAH